MTCSPRGVGTSVQEVATGRFAYNWRPQASSPVEKHRASILCRAEVRVVSTLRASTNQGRAAHRCVGVIAVQM